MKRRLLPIAAVALLGACSLSFSMDLFIHEENTNMVRELIETKQVDVNKLILSLNQTPLYRACYYQNLEIIKLIFNRCTINTINMVCERGLTALSNACLNNNLAAVQLLMSKCTIDTINKTDKYNATTLYRAVQNGNPDMVKLLLAYGANVDANSIRATQDNFYPVYPNRFAISKLLNLAQDFDRSDNKLGIIDNQSDDEIADMLCERLWKKHGRKYSGKKKAIDILGRPRVRQYIDCVIRTVV